MDTNVLYEVVEKAKKYDALAMIDRGGAVNCSFCGKRQEDVRKIIAGKGVFICDECVELCNEIIEEEIGVKVDSE